MTGADIDLLQTPSYTFSATTSDYQSRFSLVFAASNSANADSEADSFAFFSNGSWIINNMGEATLQVVDINGRILSNETVNGSVSTTINAASGVYMLRLINGENVKVQKIVVR
jgi:FtsP/CotA-like multicopper oxidase with cupredoxin domain